jgi:hypothetical protein
VTPKSDETATSGTMPAPELNPLLNPTLNKNLGRWAEVYFTNPPEKRDEAIVQLLRELESPTTTETAPRLSVKTKGKPKLSPANANAVTCRECGYENEANQRFCGDCGAGLVAAAAASATAADSRSQAGRSRSDNGGPASSRGERMGPMVPQFGSILHLTDPGPRRFRSWSTDDSEPGLTGEEYAESTPLKRSYRVFIGAVLALIIAGLAYVAWRGGQSAAGPSILPAPAPPAVTQTASSSTGPVSSTATGPPAPAAPSPAPSTENSSSTPTPATGAISNAKRESTVNPVQAQETAANSGSPAGLSGNGSQELAFAQDLLNGVGKERDSATAAQWLWKAVEKQNTAATVLLAGLYLRGDGVQKNCDQGRVLLDAAAVKGNKEAATLLRNLQAFGCK